MDERTYELIRTIAWASTRGRTPVATRTLLDRVMDVDAALREGSVDEQARRHLLRRQMDELAAVGDLAELGRGQWVSATGALVRVHRVGEQSCLLVSGIPVRYLPDAVRRALTLDGHTRVIQGCNDAHSIGLPIIDLDDWARIPDVSLDKWIADVFDAPLAKPDSDSGTFRVYLPDSTRPNSRQNDRWSAPHQSLNGRYLARQNRVGSWTAYAVVDLNSGVVVGQRELDPLDVRRLMYGIDYKRGNPTAATVRAAGGATQIHHTDPLPHPETRVLLALCGVPRNDVWTVRRDTETALGYLKGLHISIRSVR